MRIQRATTRQATIFLVALGTIAASGTLVPTASFGQRGAAAETRATSAETRATSAETRATSAEKTVDFDLRKGATAAARVGVAQRAAVASSRPAARTLAQRLGNQAVVNMDSVTGTPRMVARLDGYLTGVSTKPAASVALTYVRANLADLGLTAKDLTTLRLDRDYVDVTGIHHLSWTQWSGGIEVFSNGLQAAVTKRGQLLMLGGSPVSGLKVPAQQKQQVATAGAAISAARRSQNERAVAGPADTARQMLFVTAGSTYLGWRTITMSAEHPAVTFVDARSGRVLFRQSLEDDANAPEATSSTGTAYRYYPGSAVGGTQHAIDYTSLNWLPATASTLDGNNTHTFSDVNDDNKAQPSEEVPPRTAHSWNYALQPFNLPDVSFCNNPLPCSWNPDQRFSWRTNRAQNAAQVFYFVNTWHDHLKRSPIGFTEAAGNFQVTNSTGQGAGGDPVLSQTDDGASVDDGLPDGAHVDNANMDTPPDGQSPTMQMYLQHQPGTSYPDGDPFAPTNVGDEADTVYHEYTHGLSNRLVVDADGVSTLGNVQAGAMGEAWSDWYAMDYLVANGFQKDVQDKVDVVLFQYDGAGVALDRTEPMDCKVGSNSSKCNGGQTGHRGGYTYADFGHIAGGPEVHADGELWAQTLWDLRGSLGTTRTESLVTRAMELSPANPSYIEERNAILLADQGAYGGVDHSRIWKVFARRGMGYFAGAINGDDTAPGADFHTPPTTTRQAYITGRVVDSISGAPLPTTVTLAFQGMPGLSNPTATTTAAGNYKLGPVPVGTYPKVIAGDSGYLPASKSVTVSDAGATLNFALARDWAATTGGASVAKATGPIFSSFGCGPEAALDVSTGTGWSTTVGQDDSAPSGVFHPKYLVVQLPKAIDVSTIAVDPSNTCGDGGSAATGAYKIETSTDRVTWTTAAHGTFTTDDVGRLNTLTPTTGTRNVRYVRFTILGDQTPDFSTTCPSGPYSGCTYADLTELQVFGS